MKNLSNLLGGAILLIIAIPVAFFLLKFIFAIISSFIVQALLLLAIVLVFKVIGGFSDRKN